MPLTSDTMWQGDATHIRQNVTQRCPHIGHNSAIQRCPSNRAHRDLKMDLMLGSWRHRDASHIGKIASQRCPSHRAQHDTEMPLTLETP
ncbi:hypothetical protein DPMN_108103 [Dreissena polymorpha]|uniref:Uncharacterized protein n=1 Tax=Dreissena polymorpha TaxID=45954 RepID=A0A9D4K850_DREPO|nr:hypothetical protein DPMN_108103 [Dreissena polymorpha]